MRKRGDLSLSTNAIVMLIVMIVVLGLVITIVTRGFGGANDKIDELASSLPDPAKPTASEPITVSVPASVRLGETFAVKIAFYNGESIDLTAVAPWFTCDDASGISPGISNDPPNEVDVFSPRTSHEFTVLAMVPDTMPTGKRLCDAQVAANEYGTSPLDDAPTKSFSLNIVG